MVKDAEAHAAEDKQKRELIEARNHAEALVHATEKQLKENESNAAVATAKPDVEKAIADLKETLSSEDAERIKTATTNLAQAAMKIGEAIYAAQQGAARWRRSRDRRQRHGLGRRERRRRRLRGSEGRQEEVGLSPSVERPTDETNRARPKAGLVLSARTIVTHPVAATGRRRHIRSATFPRAKTSLSPNYRAICQWTKSKDPR